MDAEHEFLKVQEVALLLRVPRSRAYELVGRNAIPGTVRIGRSLRVNRKVLEAWLDEQASLFASKGTSG